MSETRERKDYTNSPLCLSGRGVTKIFGLGDKKTVAVDHVDFDFHEGEFVSIVGESGSGKTTLSKMLLGLINTSEGDPVAVLREISGGTGYDDVVVMAPVPAVIEQGDAILGFDGCLDFFSGPRDAGFKAPFNFYDVHYASHHIVGTSGGNVDDMKEAIDIMSKGMDPAGLITHIGGLNTVIDTTMNLPFIKGGKKMVYTQLTMPLTAIDDFAAMAEKKPAYAELDRLCKAHGGLWNAEAEAYLLSHPDEF